MVNIYIESESCFHSMFLQWDDEIMESSSQFNISTLSIDNSCCPHYLQSFSLKPTNTIAHSSVQVLLTAVQFSLSNLLLANIDVFTTARICYDSDTSYNVWCWAGSIEYGGE